MANVLMTWELGGGMGHLVRLRPLAAGMAQRGHRVVVALRDLAGAHEVFAGIGAGVVAAPTRGNGPRPYQNPVSFAHILANNGFGEAAWGQGIFGAWNTLFDLVQPDLMVTDHSPMALLAARGRVRRDGKVLPCVNVGSGFFAPPDVEMLPHWLGAAAAAEQVGQLRADETALLAQTNALLSQHGRPALARMSALYSEIADNVLATYEELDHFGPGAARRRGEVPRYWGHWSYDKGEAVEWPAGTGPKIFVYVKPFRMMEALLQALEQLRHPTLIYAPGIEPALRAAYGSSRMRISDAPLDLARVECDLAVLNANHGTLCTLLLRGKPCLMLPQYNEQLMLAWRIVALGAGRITAMGDGAAMRGDLGAMVGERRYGEAAERFAKKYRGFVPGGQIPELLDHLERVMAG